MTAFTANHIEVTIANDVAKIFVHDFFLQDMSGKIADANVAEMTQALCSEYGTQFTHELNSDNINTWTAHTTLSNLDFADISEQDGIVCSLYEVIADSHIVQ